MTNVEWVKNELSLSYDCLTTTDRIMLNRILKDLQILETLKQLLKHNLKYFEVDRVLSDYRVLLRLKEITQEQYDTLKKELEMEKNNA